MRYSKIIIHVILAIFIALNSILVLSNPLQGQVVAGSAVISSTSNTTVINQTTNKAIINWHSFNISQHEKTQFQQPSSNAITLNRINPNQGVSQIYGQLSANGRIILINQAGIHFGPTAQVNVAGIIASTADITNDNFLSGNYIFDGAAFPGATVINEGTIKAGGAGLVALIGTKVQNDGLIVANVGTVILASGSKFTFDFNGDQLINFSVDNPESMSAQSSSNNEQSFDVSNKGTVIANGGKIIMQARSARNILNNSINMSGVLIAKSVHEKNGVIVLSADQGTTRVTGKIIASGNKNNQKGGSVQVLGKKVLVENKARIDVSGHSGGGEVLIGGDYRGSNPAIINADHVYVSNNVNINADAANSGNGGKIIVWANDRLYFHGVISAKGGMLNGNGGFIETSGKNYLDIREAKVTASAVNGKSGLWLLDPRNVIIDNAATTCSSPPCFSGGDPTIYNPDTNNSHVAVSDILSALEGGTSVTITTGTTGGQTGTITVSSAIEKTLGTTPVTLTLDSTDGGGNIIVNNPITSNSGALGISLLSGNAVSIFSNIDTNGGDFISSAQNATTIGNGSGTTPGTINLGSGTADIRANVSGLGNSAFNMNVNSSIFSSNNSIDAIKIVVNSTSSGGGIATLRDITTGNGGGISVRTDGVVDPNVDTPNATGGRINFISNTTLAGGNIFFSTPSTVNFDGAINSHGTVTIEANTNASSNSFSMDPASSITTTDNSANAISIMVNNASGGSGSAVLSNLTTGSLGTITVTTDTGGNVTGGQINATGPITAGNIIWSSANQVVIRNTINLTGTVDISANTSGSGGQDFNMVTGSAISTSNSSPNAIMITVNKDLSGTGTGSAILTDISTGNGLAGTISVLTNTNGNNTGGPISINGTLAGGNVVLGSANAITLSGMINVTGTVDISANTSGSGGQDFRMNAGSSIATSSTSSDAVIISVNKDSFGTGTGSAILRDISTGNGGTITVSTNPNNNMTGNDISQSTGVLNVGNGSIFLSTPKISGDNIGTNNSPINIIANTIYAQSGSSGIYINNQNSDLLNIGLIDTGNTGGLAQIYSQGPVSQLPTSTIEVGRLTVQTYNDVGAYISLVNTNNIATQVSFSILSGNGLSTANADINYFNAGDLAILNVATLGNFNLSTTGNITTNGSLMGSSLFVRTLNDAGASIIINNINNEFDVINLEALNSTGTALANGSIVYRDATGIDIANISTLTTFDLIALGNITQSGALTVGGDMSISVRSDTFNVWLGNYPNTFDGAVNLTTATGGAIDEVVLRNISANAQAPSIPNGTQNVSIIFDNAGISLPFMNLTGNLNLNVNGPISQSSRLVIGGSLLTSSVNGIVLDNNTNDISTFNGTNNGNGDIKIVSRLPLTVTGLIQNGNGNEILDANGITLGANSAQIVLGGDTYLISNDSDIIINAKLDGYYNLTVDSGSGDIYINSDVGIITRLNGFFVPNANNFTSSNGIFATTFSQEAGDMTTFNNRGLNLTGNATIVENNVVGAVNVGGLALGTNFANLTGFVDGAAGRAAIEKIILLSAISPGTHFFDGIDMYFVPPEPQPIPAPTPIPSEPIVPENILSLIPQITFSYLYTLSDYQIENEPLAWQIIDYAGLLQALDNNQKKCINLGAHIIVCNTVHY